MAAQVKFAKLPSTKPQDLWSNVLWTDETKVEIFGQNTPHHICRKSNTARVIIRTLISKQQIIQKNKWKRQYLRCLNGPVKVQILTRLNERINEWLQTSMNGSNIVKKSGTKLLHNDVSYWWSHYFKLLLFRVPLLPIVSCNPFSFSHISAFFILRYVFVDYIMTE